MTKIVGFGPFLLLPMVILNSWYNTTEHKNYFNHTKNTTMKMLILRLQNTKHMQNQNIMTKRRAARNTFRIRPGENHLHTHPHTPYLNYDG